MQSIDKYYMPITPCIDKVDQFIYHRLTKIQLAELRAKKHITQKDLSVTTGLSIGCISGIESSTTSNPRLDSLLRYLDALGYEMVFKRRQII